MIVNLNYLKEEHDLIYKRLEKELLLSCSWHQTPRVVIIGGQPGAGKSKQIDVAVQSFLDAGVAVINGDDYRMSHPQKDKIL